MKVRVYVGGSREWRWPQVIAADLDAEWTQVQRDCGDSAEMVVVHGAARGTDQQASEWCELVGSFYEGAVTEDPFPVTPAEWQRFGRRAGMLRNRRALESGITKTFFYILDESSGSVGALRIARRLGIERVVRLRGRYGEILL